MLLLSTSPAPGRQLGHQWSLIATCLKGLLSESVLVNIHEYSARCLGALAVVFSLFVVCLAAHVHASVLRFTSQSLFRSPPGAEKPAENGSRPKLAAGGTR